MPELKTWAGKGRFRYSGSIETGTQIHFGRGFGVRAVVSEAHYQELLEHFSSRTVSIGTSRTPPARSVGEWLQKHVTATAIASYVGPILVAEGYAQRLPLKRDQIQFVSRHAVKPFERKREAGSGGTGPDGAQDDRKGPVMKDWVFSPRFDLNRVAELADRYDYDGDVAETEITPHVKDRGYYRREEFLAVCGWKSPRIVRKCRSNPDEFVEAVTRVALSPETTSERLRIEVLLLLKGVGWPVASVLLHFGHRDRYPILDFRALWSLRIDPPPAYSFDFWWKYVECSRELSDAADVPMRVLDRALWQYSKENQTRDSSTRQ